MDRLLTNLVAGVWLIVALLGNTSTTHAAQDKQQPNVIVFLADDQGFGDYGFQGNPDLETPHLDSMARNGALFETFLVCPVCSPTRAEFLTGRYSARSGVVSTSAGGERMALGEQTVAELFRESGYATAAFGKWHNGMQYPYHPLGRGFDEFYGFCSGHWGNYFSPILEHNGQLVRGEGFVVDDFTSKAISFIEQHQDQPFFVYLPYNTPHSPMQVPDAYWERFEEKEITLRSSKPERENLFHTRAALAMCENIDWNVGRVLTTLDDLNIAEETIVLYFSDNGPNGLRFNGGLKGRKGSTDEGGVRSPLLMQWNGTIEPGTRVQQLAGAIDLLPTLVDLCQLEVEPRNPLDGISLKPFVLDEAAPLVDREIVTFWKGRASLRNQDFRLDNDGNLFHLAEDPGQTTVVSENFPEVHERLTDLLNIARAQMDPRGLDIPEEPFPVGHSDFAFTQLPARDAQVTGAIRRSNRFPNCSYFTDWKNVEDHIYWPVEVLEPGLYRAEIFYTCAAADSGVRLSLEFFDESVEGTIDEANDPPELGAENDRVERMESYVKEFKPFEIGTIELAAGRGNLVLRSLEIPGDASIDFRMLFLTRLDDETQEER